MIVFFFLKKSILENRFFLKQCEALWYNKKLEQVDVDEQRLIKNYADY